MFELYFIVNRMIYYVTGLNELDAFRKVRKVLARMNHAGPVRIYSRSRLVHTPFSKLI